MKRKIAFVLAVVAGVTMLLVQNAQSQGLAASAIRRVAEQFNEPGAQFILGRMYLLGQEVGKDMKEAERWFKKSAGQGNADAQFELAKLYVSDSIGRTNFAEAVRLLKLAVEEEHRGASYLLGELYLRGKGVAQNHAQAAVFLREAALDGHTQAQFLLGGLYHKGHGVAKNRTKAISWYEQAAQQGFSDAQYMLGKIYLESSDPVNAVHWLKLAADQGNEAALISMQDLQDKPALARKAQQAKAKRRSTNEPQIALLSPPPAITPANLEPPKPAPTVKLSAFENYSAKAKQGNLESQYSLGMMYEKGLGIDKNIKRAVAWYLKAAKKGHINSQYQLGQLYVSGEGVRQDMNTAKKWFHKAARQGSAGAQFRLGTMYSELKGEQNKREAKKWLKKASDQGIRAAEIALNRINAKPVRPAKPSFEKQLRESSPDQEVHLAQYLDDAKKGDPEAQLLLGVRYSVSQEIGKSRDAKKAIKWLTEAAENGRIWAQYELANIYRQGRGVKTDYTKAARWYFTAAMQGHADSQYYLGMLYNDGLGVKRSKAKAGKWFHRAADRGSIKAKYLISGCSDC